eukprot:6211244-Pleurochrysis_carterae.AAC.2
MQFCERRTLIKKDIAPREILDEAVQALAMQPTNHARRENEDQSVLHCTTINGLLVYMAMHQKIIAK